MPAKGLRGAATYPVRRNPAIAAASATRSTSPVARIAFGSDAKIRPDGAMAWYSGFSPIRSRARTRRWARASHSASEHALELIHEVQPEVLVKMGDHLGIAPGAEAMPRALEPLAQRPVIVDLAVADHADRAVLVRERLPTVRDVDDRQPPAAESGAALDRHPVAVGTAVDQRLTHALEQGRIRLPARTHHDTVDPAHQSVPTWCRGVMPTCTRSLLLDPRE